MTSATHSLRKTIQNHSIKVNMSVYIAKSRQRFDVTLNNFLLHVPNHALKGLYMLNDETKYNINTSYYQDANRFY